MWAGVWASALFGEGEEPLGDKHGSGLLVRREIGVCLKVIILLAQSLCNLIYQTVRHLMACCPCCGPSLRAFPDEVDKNDEPKQILSILTSVRYSVIDQNTVPDRHMGHPLLSWRP